MQAVSSISTTALTLAEIENDPQFKILATSIAKEAMLKSNPNIDLFVVNKNKFTVVNHTDQHISLNLNRILFINKIAIAQFSEDYCQIAAYHLEDHPEIICLEEKNTANPKPEPRFFAELTWKATDARDDYSEAYRTVPGGLKLDVDLLAPKKIAPYLPLNFKLPDNIEENTKKNLMHIMQEISPAAILSSTPRWTDKTLNGTKLRILNFTSHELNFNQIKELTIDNKWIVIQKASILFSSHCCMIAYHVEKYPHIICLDVKYDYKNNLGDRIFLTKDDPDWPSWSSKYAHKCVVPIEFQNLLKLQTTCVQDPDEYMKSNNDIKELVNEIPSEAILRSTPQVTLYKSRLNSSKNVGCVPFTIVNHTNHDIRPDVNNRLYIGNSIVHSFECETGSVNYQIIAYHLKGQPQKIIFEQLEKSPQYMMKEKKAYNLSWSYCPTSKKCEAIFKELRKKGVFKQLWLAKHDEKSPFYKAHFTEEITNQIFHFYALLN